MTIRRQRRLLSVVAFAALVAAGTALAATPIKGATYSGKIARASNVTYSISFTVSTTGERVRNFALANGYPVYCQGGGFGAVQQASGKISKEGAFVVKLPIYFAPSHQHQGFVIITGRFAKHGKESGKVMTDFTHSNTCNGTSSYATKAG